MIPKSYAVSQSQKTSLLNPIIRENLEKMTHVLIWKTKTTRSQIKSIPMDSSTLPIFG